MEITASTNIFSLVTFYKNKISLIYEEKVYCLYIYLEIKPFNSISLYHFFFYEQSFHLTREIL